jgi:hypothetical protein
MPQASTAKAAGDRNKIIIAIRKAIVKSNFNTWIILLFSDFNILCLLAFIILSLFDKTAFFLLAFYYHIRLFYEMGLFKVPRLLTIQNARDARRTKNESLGVYKNTSSGAVCSETRQMSVL